jgi:hypothetical protein
VAYVALSIVKIFNQLNAAYPGRNKGSDGTWGDEQHRVDNPGSDHFPNALGQVTAGDITEDPAHGVNIDQLSDALVGSRDPRIKYIICRGLILDTRQGNHPWQWMPYYGKDQHMGHLHLSVLGGPIADNLSPWVIGSPTTEEDLMDQYTPFTGAPDVLIGGKPASNITRPLRWWFSAIYAHGLATEDLVRSVAGLVTATAKGVASIDAMDDENKAAILAAQADVAKANTKLDELKSIILDPPPAG